MATKVIPRQYLQYGTYSPGGPLSISVGALSSTSKHVVLCNVGDSAFFARGYAASPLGPHSSPYVQIIPDSTAGITINGTAGQDIGIQVFKFSDPRFISLFSANPGGVYPTVDQKPAIFEVQQMGE